MQNRGLPLCLPGPLAISRSVRRIIESIILDTYVDATSGAVLPAQHIGGRPAATAAPNKLLLQYSSHRGYMASSQQKRRAGWWWWASAVPL